MLKHYSVIALLTAAVLSTGCTASPRDAGLAATTVQAAQHDPGRAHDALVFCIDTSLSPLPDQFDKILAIVLDTIRIDVQANDLVWLLATDTSTHPPVLFTFPAAGLKRSETDLAQRAMQAERERLIGTLHKFVQAAKVTDIRTSGEYGLNILDGQRRARRKRFVLASDFIQDVRPGGASTDPPSPSPGLSASGVEIVLLVARPKPEYLNQLHLTAAELYHIVSSRWIKYYRELGAVSARAVLVDAVPVAKRPMKRRVQ